MDRNILETILVEKRKEVVLAAAARPLSDVQASAAQLSPALGFCERLRNASAPAIIAEIKRASPSKGLIRPDLDPVRTAIAFSDAGASCLSILTDEKFFQGSLNFLIDIREALREIPLLRKDFICHPYQVWQTRAAGADALLLIVAALEDEDLHFLFEESLRAGLDILLEAHTEEELERLSALLKKFPQAQKSSIVGINNRDLKTFSVDLEVTNRLINWAKKRPEFEDSMFISESGILSSADLLKVSSYGAKAFLIGEVLVKVGSPGDNLSRMIREFRN